MLTGQDLARLERASTPIMYVAHPIGSTEPERANNLARARRWLRWLIASHPDRAFVMPWLAYCDVLEETPDNRARGIRDDLTVLRRCDGIVLVGGRISPGMREEARIAFELGLMFWNLAELGDEPPRTGREAPCRAG